MDRGRRGARPSPLLSAGGDEGDGPNCNRDMISGSVWPLWKWASSQRCWLWLRVRAIVLARSTCWLASAHCATWRMNGTATVFSLRHILAGLQFLGPFNAIRRIYSGSRGNTYTDAIPNDCTLSIGALPSYINSGVSSQRQLFVGLARDVLTGWSNPNNAVVYPSCLLPG